MSPVRIGIVGAGVAGTLLALRLGQSARRPVVHLYAGPDRRDATAASGGLVRGYEPRPELAELASASLAELRADRTLRDAAVYREIGSVYRLPAGAEPGGSVALVHAALPGSATVRAVDGSVEVVERLAGYLSPARLRDAVLARLGAVVRALPVRGVLAGPALRLADGGVAGYDAVVLATGPWTPALLATSGLAGAGLRTKQIQYTVFRGRANGSGVFVDEDTGLYGRPEGDIGWLLGLPCDRWDVDPARLDPDVGLAHRVAELARQRLGAAVGEPVRTVAACDCYTDPAGLALRPVGPGTPVFTFTGGSGGAAKTVLAASRTAALALLGQV